MKEMCLQQMFETGEDVTSLNKLFHRNAAVTLKKQSRKKICHKLLAHNSPPMVHPMR